MQVPNYFRSVLKRRDVLVIFLILCLAIAFLSWQFGLAELANQKAPNSAEQYKIIYPYLAGILILTVPFLVNSYIDEQVRQEVGSARAKARQLVEQSETSQGIKAKQELEFVALCARVKQGQEEESVVSTASHSNFLLLDSLINIDALLPAVRQEIYQPNSSIYLFTLSQEEKSRELAVLSLLKTNRDGDEFALLLVRTAVYRQFSISKENLANHPESEFHNTICKELYIFIRAWLVCSLQAGRYMPVQALKITYPHQKGLYKATLAKIYLDAIHREKSKIYLPSHPGDQILVIAVIESYLKWLISEM